MFEIADRLLRVLDAGVPVAIATAISIEGSAPRTVGTSMAFDGVAVIGSIAGGCVEGAVVEVAEEVLADGIARTVEYGVSDETAFSVGLTCGGQLRIHVQRVDAASPVTAQLRLAAAGGNAGIASVIGGGVKAGEVTGGEVAGSAVAGSAASESRGRQGSRGRHASRIDAELGARIALGEGALTSIDCDGEILEVFFEVATAPPRMIILGAMEFSAALSSAASVLGYRVTVCDPRPLFATPARFPGAETIVSWPTTFLAATPIDERTVICVLSHDARFDAEAIAIALASPARYVGAMGSRRTHDRRVASLRERDVDEASIARLHSPIGLDIGASTPEETAVSILAEVLAARAGGSATPLRDTEGTIHRSQAQALA
jgi:xanthine dehydrogenase accessory factor